MTAHPIDTEEARVGAEAHLRYGGGGDDLAENVLALLDALAAAEHRATRAEAQATIRCRAVVIYRERAREAEARIKAVQELHAEVEGLHCHTVCSHRSCLDDSGDQHHYPCPTIRALDATTTTQETR